MLENKRVKLKRMLEDLGEENTKGGFNEYSQFCEESLANLINIMTVKQIDWLMGQIEETTKVSINRIQY